MTMAIPSKYFCVFLLMVSAAQAADGPIQLGSYQVRDTLAPAPDSSADAQDCLDHLIWTPEEFAVVLEPAKDPVMEAYVRFPSPRPNGVPINDRVALEWYSAKDDSGKIIDAPAVIVVHESGANMEVGKIFAKAFHAQGLHAFMIQMPFYGLRRPQGFKPGVEHVEPTMKQGIADVRRARDAVAVLPHVIGSNVALQGTSLGGFVASTAAGLDRGFQSVHIMVAGGDIYNLVEHGQREAGKFREMLAAAGYTGDKLRALFNQIEPLRLAHRLDPGTTWLYTATKDQVVPPIHGMKLAEAARLPDDHHIRLWADHYTGIVYMPIVVQSMARNIREMSSVK